MKKKFYDGNNGIIYAVGASGSYSEIETVESIDWYFGKIARIGGSFFYNKKRLVASFFSELFGGCEKFKLVKFFECNEQPVSIVSNNKNLDGAFIIGDTVFTWDYDNDTPVLSGNKYLSMSEDRRAIVFESAPYLQIEDKYIESKVVSYYINEEIHMCDAYLIINRRYLFSYYQKESKYMGELRDNHRGLIEAVTTKETFLVAQIIDKIITNPVLRFLGEVVGIENYGEKIILVSSYDEKKRPVVYASYIRDHHTGLYEKVK